MKKNRSNILVLYWYIQYPPRNTLAEHLYSFEKYSGHNCYYVNLAVRGFPWYLKKIRFDLVIFHTIFLSKRWRPEAFQGLLEKVDFLKDLNAVKIALPQDEFIQTDLLRDFINRFNINGVFSVAPETEWQKIYAGIDFQKVKVFKVLTGYLSDGIVERIRQLSSSTPEKDIDIGYRALNVLPCYGRSGLLKTRIGEVFAEKVPRYGLKADISTRPEDTFFGNAWYKFMLRCKYMIGVEGGSAIIDRDGSIRERTLKYMEEHPTASFEAIEEACFPGLDGSLRLFAISPRHLEACAARTCQVLVEGEYSGILEPWKHYLPLKPDFSNIDQVMELIRQDTEREKITENAYRDIVNSGRYVYPSFVDFVLENSLALSPVPPLFPRTMGEKLFYRWSSLADRASWVAVAVLYNLYRVAKAIIPEKKIISFLTRMKI